MAHVAIVGTITTEIKNHNWLTIGLNLAHITSQVLQLIKIESKFFTALFFTLSFLAEFESDCDHKVIHVVEFLHKLFIIAHSFFGQIESRIK